MLLLSGEGRADTALFRDQVKPLLDSKCVSCHGADKQKGGLRLDSRAAALKGGEHGPAFVPGDVQKSRLLMAVRHATKDLAMPPKEKLPAKDIATLEAWVKAGAPWPTAATVLFEDEEEFLAVLTSGNGKARLVTDDVFAGKAALGMTPLQREAAKVPGWNFEVRETPQAGQVRFMRFAWKKRGGGSVMFELARSGAWPDAKEPKGRYVAGPNTTGWAAISVGDTAPAAWTVVTVDLWKDLGNCALTGLAPTCDKGEEALFDSVILGPDVASLDAYAPGKGQLALKSAAPAKPLGDAWTDPENPIRRIWRGERLDLWSLKQPARHTVPSVGHRPSAGNPIDAFLLAKLAEKKLTFSPEADRRTLIRRLCFDLLGLPPTPEEISAFVADKSADAYERLVDKLLASPHYGERWARHWLDVVRYADTNGHERDEFRPEMWRYRDYVVRALNAFLPTAFQATKFRHEGEPVFNLQPPAEFAATQRDTLDLIQAFNQTHRDARPGLLDLDGRIASYELAYRMQSEALDVGDLSGESAATLELYGVNDAKKIKAQYGRQCLLARRLLERGVRVVQVYQGVDKYGWDGHDNNKEYAERNAHQTDQATGALLTDLKQRGLLDDTLVVWAGEFGRTPMQQGGAGRNHNPYGFTGWLAGGGVKGGQSIGATDAIGLRAEQEPKSVKDFHATILHALGLANDDLFFEHNGRPERLTGVAGTGKAIREAFV